MTGNRERIACKMPTVRNKDRTFAVPGQSGLEPPALLARRSVIGVISGDMFFPGMSGRLEEADAAVPAEDGVVVARGTDFFGFAGILQSAFEQRKKRVRRLAGAELGLGTALVKNSGVVEALVIVGKTLEDFFAFAIAIGSAAEKLVSDGKTEHTKGELLLGLDG